MAFFMSPRVNGGLEDGARLTASSLELFRSVARPPEPIFRFNLSAHLIYLQALEE
ncbi:hypothetical protein HanIR_Chr05g0211701 [Helianthus annuus]|nr:hypothetical protein HanIR_Chr05g0211701 [Helianthus annuus]